MSISTEVENHVWPLMLRLWKFYCLIDQWRFWFRIDHSGRFSPKLENQNKTTRTNSIFKSWEERSPDSKYLSLKNASSWLVLIKTNKIFKFQVLGQVFTSRTIYVKILLRLNIQINRLPSRNWLVLKWCLRDFLFTILEIQTSLISWEVFNWDIWPQFSEFHILNKSISMISTSTRSLDNKFQINP